MFITYCLGLFVALLSSTTAPPKAELIPIDKAGLLPRQAASTTTRPADPTCTNGPSTRACWGNGYSVNTNYDAVWPIIGSVVRYSLDIQNKTLAPDGFARPVYAVNGQYPGPTIRAKWGDVLEITVHNSLTTNGSGIHWHGIRQWHTNSEDGTPGVTEVSLQAQYEMMCPSSGLLVTTMLSVCLLSTLTHDFNASSARLHRDRLKRTDFSAHSLAPRGIIVTTATSTATVS
jgi:hypothetical protein